jgi:hypothetical protein
LPEHVHHLHLEHRVDGLNTDARAALRHRKHIHHADSEVVDKLAKHQTHDFHRYTGAAVTQHLEQGEGRDMDRLGVVDQGCAILEGYKC